MRISPNFGYVGVAYTGTLLLANTTHATITNLPSGLQVTWYPQLDGSLRGDVTGIPQQEFNANLAVVAENRKSNCTATQSTLRAGDFKVTKIPCTAPVVTQPLIPAFMTLNVPYTGTIVLQHATELIGLLDVPEGVTYTAAFISGNLVINVTGTPTIAAVHEITAIARNTCVGGAPTTVQGMPVSTGTSGGTTHVYAAAVVADFAIIKSASSPTVGQNEIFTWAIQVTNRGPHPAHAIINDVLTAPFTQTTSVVFPYVTPMLQVGDIHVVPVAGYYSTTGAFSNTATASALLPAVDVNSSNSSATGAILVTEFSTVCPARSTKYVEDCAGDRVYGLIATAGDTRPTVTFTDGFGDSMLLAASSDVACGLVKQVVDCYGNTGFGFI